MLLAWPFWIFVILMFILTAGLFMRTLWSYKIPWQRAKLFVLIVGLVAAEGGYAISLLPTNYVVNALWLVAVYYLLMNIIKDYLKDVLSPQRTRTYLLISSLAIILTMLTTKWQ